MIYFNPILKLQNTDCIHHKIKKDLNIIFTKISYKIFRPLNQRAEKNSSFHALQSALLYYNNLFPFIYI